MINIEEQGFAKDDYLIEDNCVNRLLREWDERGYLIVAYDFDDTVNGTYQTNCVCDQMIELIRACKEMGCKLIVYTARPYDEIPEVEKYLHEHDIPYDYMNENVPNLDFKSGAKLVYNIFFDDRCGLASAYQIMVKTIKLRLEQTGNL